jgi:hypothetical protein
MARIRPNLLFVYLPHLDYSCQIHGPANQKILEELGQMDREVDRIVVGIEDLDLGKLYGSKADGPRTNEQAKFIFLDRNAIYPVLIQAYFIIQVCWFRKKSNFPISWIPAYAGMTIRKLKSDRYHRRHTRAGGYPAVTTTFYDFINFNHQ